MSNVYFLKIREQSPEMMIEAGKKISAIIADIFNFEDKVAIKVHFGEKGNRNHASPIFVEKIYNNLKEKVQEICLMDCNVLYKGERSQGPSHIKLAKEHGFGFGKIVIADDQEGEEEIEIKIDQKHFSFVKVGKKLENYNAILVITHVTGHGGTGYGGAIKNVGMGLGSRAGKLEMHQAFKLRVDSERCQACGLCASQCPADAISVEGTAQINQDKCIGCAKCISVCPNDSILIPWDDGGAENLQERIVEYCCGILKNKKVYFINILLNITESCDCMGGTESPMVKDIGILVSNDLLAVERATIDLVGKKYFERGEINPLSQINYAEKLNLGNTAYKLIKIN